MEHQPLEVRLASANEECWQLVGSIADLVGDAALGSTAWDRALAQNPASVRALLERSEHFRRTEEWPRAVEYL